MVVLSVVPMVTFLNFKYLALLNVKATPPDALRITTLAGFPLMEEIVMVFPLPDPGMAPIKYIAS